MVNDNLHLALETSTVFALLCCEFMVVDSSLPSAIELATAMATASLALGFWFHLTDEELVGYYLKRKYLGKTINLVAIGELNIHKHEICDFAGCLEFFIFLCICVIWVPLWYMWVSCFWFELLCGLGLCAIFWWNFVVYFTLCYV